MKTDISVFCNTCLHCLTTIGGQRVPRPLGHAIHADKPNQLIHFNFLYMYPGDDNMKYVFIIKDDHSSFVLLEATEDCDAQTATKTLLKWFSMFGVVPNWNSDQGSHFKNKLMDNLNRELHAHHHFTTPYNPQSNGTVESVCREFLRTARALLSEFRLDEKKWPSILPMIQSILNNSKRPSLGDRAPITVLTGQPSDNPLRTIVLPNSITPTTLTKVQQKKLSNIENLKNALDKMHKDVAMSRTRKRKLEIERHNKFTKIQPINFDLGDYVLVSKLLSNRGHKLKVRWTGPKRITRADSVYIFEVEDLISNKKELVHAERLKLYADSKLDLSEELLSTIEHNNPHYYAVTALTNLRFNEEKQIFEVKCQWRGFSNEESTWEPISNIREDIPDTLEKFLLSFRDQKLANAARIS